MTAVTAAVFDGTDIGSGTVAVAALAFTPNDKIATFTVNNQVTVMKIPT